jgi:uncharacterized membrane protein
VLFTLLVVGISAGLSFVPFVGSLASVVISPPLSVGYFFVADKIRRGEAYTFNNFFDGFKAPFGQLIVLSLISSILTVVGTIFCILPGIYLAIGYSLSNCVLVFHKFEFWEAMEASRKVVSKNFWTFLGLFLVMGIGGALAIILTCGVGSLFVAPVIVLTIYCIYIKIFEVK